MATIANAQCTGLDGINSIWHEPSEKPTREGAVVFLAESCIVEQYYKLSNPWGPGVPWCYESDLARMLHNMQKAEKEPKAKQKPVKLEWQTISGIEFDKGLTPKVTIKKCTLEETSEGLKYSEVETVNEPKTTEPVPCGKCKDVSSLFWPTNPRTDGLYVVRCYNCNQSTFGETLASTIAAWNERQKEKERAESLSPEILKAVGLDQAHDHVMIPPQTGTITGEAKTAAGTGSALDRQVGGRHYKSLAIQPVEYIEKNKIPYTEGCVIKYVTRHREKGGADDLKKAIHFIEMLLEREYPKAAKTAG